MGVDKEMMDAVSLDIQAIASGAVWTVSVRSVCVLSPDNRRDLPFPLDYIRTISPGRVKGVCVRGLCRLGK
jgi:hypothetical protein